MRSIEKNNFLKSRTDESHGSEDMAHTQWYVSKASSFSGPFYEHELIQQIKKNQINETDLVWTRKKNNWIQITEISVFKATFDNIKKIKEANNQLKNQVFEAGSSNNSLKTELTNQVKNDWKGSDEFWNYIRNTNSVLKNKNSSSHQNLLAQVNNERPMIIDDPQLEVIQKKSMRTRVNVRRSFAIGMMVSIMITVFTVKDRFKEIEDIDGLTASQNIEAKSILRQIASEASTRASLFLKSTPDNPKFHIIANLKDKSEVLLKIEGISETLVGSFLAQYQVVLKIKNSQAQSPSLLNETVTAMPMGEYKVSVLCLDCQNEKLPRHFVLAENTLFLGGEKDDTYDLKLVKYHTELRQKAREELQMYAQIVQTLQKQHSAFQSDYKTAIETHKSQDRWLIFYDRWLQTQTQLKLEVERLLSKNSRNEIYYSELLKQINQAMVLMSNLESQKNKEIKMYIEASKSSQQRMRDHAVLSHEITQFSQALLTKIAELETLPLTANGMPRKTKH